MKYAFLLVGLLLLSGPSLKADLPPGTIKEYAPGVWFREGGGNGICNTIIIEMKDYLIVVDAPYPSGAKAVIAEAKKLSPKPIKYVIDTHDHPDHSYGNHLFTEIGATTIAYVGAYEAMQRYEPARWQEVSRSRQDVKELNMPFPEPPEMLYTKSPYVITDGSRKVELYFLGLGHTSGDTFVYLPQEQILCTGDAAPNGPHSDPKNAYMIDWIKEVQAAQKLSAKYVLPAHGDPGGPELLSGQIEFLVDLHDAVAAAIKRGEKLDQIVTFKDGQPVATSITLPEKIMDIYVTRPGPGVPPWKLGRFPTQVMAEYEEIVQGIPYVDVVTAK
jgi:cyclase